MIFVTWLIALFAKDEARRRTALKILKVLIGRRGPKKPGESPHSEE